jgi:hypothetical protein
MAQRSGTHTDSKNSGGTALLAIITEIEVVLGRDEACGLMHAMPYLLLRVGWVVVGRHTG